MADYVERGKVIAALEAEKHRCYSSIPRQNMTFQSIIGVIKTCKGEDMVPRSEYEQVVLERDAAVAKLKGRSYSFTEKLRGIVFCRECSHCFEKDMFGVKKVLECRRIDRAVGPAHYCAYGVRRDNDG